jgi:hypothetical protein
MHHRSLQYLARPKQRAAHRLDSPRAPSGKRDCKPMPRCSSKGAGAGPASLLPTVLVTALALGALLWAAPGADGDAGTTGQPVAMPIVVR